MAVTYMYLPGPEKWISELDACLERCSLLADADNSNKSHATQSKPTVLGVLANRESKHLTYPKQGNEEFWLSIFLNAQLLPEIRSIYDKNEQSNKQTSVEIIFYDQPNPEYLQYLALDPLVLDVSAKETSTKLAYASEDIDSTSLSESEYGVIKNVKKIISQSIFMTNGADGDDDFGINSSFYLEKSVNEFAAAKLDAQRSQSMIVSALMRLARNAKLAAMYIFSPIASLAQALRSFIIGPGMGLLFVVRFLIEITLFVLNLQMPKWILNGVALKDLSAAAQQVDLRLQQLCFWPGQYMLVRKRRWANTAATRAQYISFYNSMWLIANDIIIGITVGSFLIHNSEEMSVLMHDILNRYTVNPLQMMMDWLLRSPGGLKLNDELGKFLSELFSWLIRLWIGKKRNVLRHRIDSCDYDLDQLLLGTSLFTLLMFLFPTVFSYYLTFASGRVGIIFSQAVMETLLAFFNHFPLFAIMLRIKDPGRLPGGLTFDVCQPDVFRKRRRVIRFLNRQWLKIAQAWKQRLEKPVVSNDAEAPAAARAQKGHRPKQRSVHFYDTPASEILRQNSPESKRTSNGILQKNMGCIQGSYIYVRNLPIPFGAIFFQYMLLWKRLSSHYFSSYVLTCLVYGEPIKPIPKLQYAMLPDNRPSLRDFWEILKSSFQED
ncbi:pig-Q [Umbelopsis nana]